MRTIFHVDMDAFFVSVEEIFDPSLKGRAVVVGGQRDQRGVVSAASYEARRFGVHSAMPLRTAAKLCSHAIFVQGHHERYREYSAKVYRILQQFTPKLEMASIDEAYLDMSGTERLHGPALAASHALHERIKSGTGLNASIGIAASRLVAKVASDQAKPNGVLQVLPGCEAAFLAPLDVRKIPGVGKVTEAQLHALGIRQVRDFSRFEEDFLQEKFGRWGLALAGKARGEDAGGWFDSDIGAADTPKSISHEITYDQDTADTDLLESTIVQLSGMVARRLRSHGLHARTVQIKFRYSDFTTFTRAHSLDQATQIDHTIADAAKQLFLTNWTAGRKIRLIGIQASNFETDPALQIALLAPGSDQKWEQALRAVDLIRDKYGETSVGSARGLRGKYRERVHENPADLLGKRGEREPED